MHYLIILLNIVLCVQLALSTDFDFCSEPPQSGVCSTMFIAWFYNATKQECQEFVYLGCGGNKNRFKTEEECYSHCKEKLIHLHPPRNVTVAYVRSNRLYLYWFPPVNYKLHTPLLTNETLVGSAGGARSSPVLIPVGSKRVSRSVSSNDNSTETGSTPSNTTANNTNTTESGGNSTSTDTKMGEDSSTASPTVATNTGEEVEIAGTNLSITDYIEKEKVPFHFARLTHYLIVIMLSSGELVKQINVPGNITEQNITGLSPSTEYIITVSAVYLTNSTVSAKNITAKTSQDPSKATNCYCDPYGTINGYKTCNLSLSHVPWCECKPRHAGLFCEICGHGYYRTTPSLPCHTCPCPKTFSTGSCHFMEGYLHCTTCKEGYTGNLCHRCANGYYRDHINSPTKCIKCHGCHDITPGLICDPFSGKCLNCHYNTTGERCNRCLDGFQGDPLNKIPCVPIAKEHKAMKTPAAGMIAAIVIAIIVLLSGIVGFIVYKRSHNFPKNKPFWTIEFKEDHDDVNFSAVPDDELERQHDDMRFYESQSRGKNKLPPYAQLKEDD
ncbi:uncharacterized protein LOC132757449 [Ruditapes philippinarum]|uniref:uncharacterized protein LOC132757449 n=1 Tax=Ruditapes philippinarum TaxID=129788 RepID=UPI00295A914C|nr:uncharacterized protein LOC132757449 [Ruditapes philippinarum]